MSEARVTVFVLTLLVALLSGVDTLAMVVLPADFTEMVTGSQIVVHGRVVAVRSQLIRDRRTIETIISLSVVDALKGTPGEIVHFRVPSGQVGRYRRVMVGAPEFTEGEEVVLFLTGRAPMVPVPFGLSQGVYRVARGANGQPMVTRPVAPDVPGRVVRGDPARRPVELTAFTRAVRTIAEGRP